MAQPLLRLLKSRQGQGPIDVMAPPAVAPVWRAMAETASVIETPFRHGALQWRERRAFAAQMRQTGYADAYVLPNSLKFALIPWLAGIPRRVGYLGEMRYGLLNVVHHDSDAAPRPMISFYAALAAPPAARAPAILELPRPCLVVDNVTRAGALERFQISPASPIIVFAPGAEFGAAKRWPARHFAALAATVLRNHPAATVLLLGSPKDRSACDDITVIANAGPAIRNLAGATSLGDAIALISAAAAVVSNDSGLLHVASGLNRPVVALYGPTDPLHAPPFSEIAASLYLHLDCAPCRQRECPLGHHACMENLTCETVWVPLREMLGSTH